MSFVQVGDDQTARPRPRWPLALAAATLAVAAGVGTAYLVAADDDDARTAAAPTESPDPVLSRTPSPTASPAAPLVPAPRATASPTRVAPPAAPSPTPTPRVTASPTPARAPSRSAAPTVRPSPTRSAGRAFPAKGLVVDVTGEPISGDPPAVRFRIRVRDNDGSAINGTIDFGDGTSNVYSRRPAETCRTRPSSPPPGYRARPIDQSFTVTHPYEAAGTFTVVVTANTERPCEGTPAETARRQLTVVIPQRAPSPSPSP
ncbi:MAG TPA: hypothetical protein VNB94_11960 [Mycobacteriales bacterium]|nr:hypothetical protein [Mycobacteriales bacterium]